MDMRDFPQESISLAREIASKYRRRTKSKVSLASHLYARSFFEISYGFDEAIKSGNCGMYLHEITKGCDCFTMAGVLYLIARESGLSPRMYWASEMRDVPEGGNPSDHQTADHAFIVVPVSKIKELLVDPHMVQVGEVRFVRDRNLIRIRSLLDDKIINRTYGAIKELSQEEYLEKLEENRTSGGGIIALAASQKVRAAGRKGVLITYLPDTREIRAETIEQAITFNDEPFCRFGIVDLITRLENNGDFNFHDGRFEFYFVSSSGWNGHQGKQVPLSFPVSEAEKLWGIWQGFFSSAGRKTKISRMAPARLDHNLRVSGFRDTFTLVPGSRGEQFVASERLEESLGEVLQAQEACTESFVKACRDDEVSYRTLLRSSQYTKESDLRVFQDNPYGLISTPEEREALVVQAFEDFKVQNSVVRVAFEEEVAINLRLRRGSGYHAGRRASSCLEVGKTKTDYIGSMASLRKSKLPFLFHFFADQELFYRRFDVAKMPISDLEAGLTEQDLRRSAQRKLFGWLVNALTERDALFLASYQRGLRKILNIES